MMRAGKKFRGQTAEWPFMLLRSHPELWQGLEYTVAVVFRDNLGRVSGRLVDYCMVKLPKPQGLRANFVGLLAFYKRVEK